MDIKPMQVVVRDGRKLSKRKNLPNTQRFKRKIRGPLKKAAEEYLLDHSLGDIFSDGNKQLKPQVHDGIKEPTFRHGKGGITEGVYSGNKEYISGDTIKRPEDGEKGSGGGESGEGVVDFVVEVSQEEFLDLLFDDLELFHKIKKSYGDDEFEIKQAGISRDGPPNRIHLVRSFIQAIARRKVFKAPLEEKIRVLEEELKKIDKKGGSDHEEETP